MKFIVKKKTISGKIVVTKDLKGEVMKKLIIVLLILSLVITGCSSKEVSDDKKEPTEVKEEVKDEEKDKVVEEEKDKEEEKDVEEDKDVKEEDMSKFCVPGYQLGEIPAIPVIEVPTIPSYSEEQKKVLDSVKEKIESIPGVTVKEATCENGEMVYVSGFLVSDEDSSVTTTEEGSSVVNEDGSGVLNTDDVTAVVNEDGGGVVNKDGVSVVVAPDGSGTISDDENGITIVRSPDGTGTYESNDVSITISGEYSGVYTGSNYSLIYSEKGKAQYSDDDLSIMISDGKAMITKGEDTITVDAKPLAKVPLIGKIPTLEKLERDNVCGIRIVFDDSILFDFDKFDLRPEGKEVIKKVVGIVSELNIESIEVHGHTDSMASDEYNMELSNNRANSVKEYAMEMGITSSVTAKGFGETKPVAPNKNSDGSDNPAGRQANRRVEFFIPVK